MKSSSLEGPPILALRRTAGAWQASGRISARLGNLAGEVSLPHLPSAGWTYGQGMLTAHSDRHGFVPIYFYDGPKGFGLAGSWVHLQQHFELERFDDGAIACYLRLGHYLADDTPFEGVRRMPPNSKLTWSDGVCRIEEANSGLPAPTFIERSDAIAEYGLRFQKAMESILAATQLSPIGLISGGQDSRHILLAMIEAGVRPAHCITQEPPWRGDQDDAAVALSICEALGVPVELIAAEPRSVEAELRKNRLLGMESIYHSWLLPIADVLCSLDRGLIFDGLGGDALSASRFLTDEWIGAVKTGRVTEAAVSYMGAEGHLPSMLRPRQLARWPRVLAEERVAAELSRYLHYPNPQAAFQIRNRTRRAIAASLWPLLARGHDVALPYFHPEVFDFLISLPMGMLTGRKLHREAIDARYPAFRNVPYAVNGNRPAAPDSRLLPRRVRDGFDIAGHRRLAAVLRPNYLRLRSARALLQRSYVDRLDEFLQPAAYLDQLIELTESSTG